MSIKAWCIKHRWAASALGTPIAIALMIVGAGLLSGGSSYTDASSVLPIVASRLSPVPGLKEARLVSGERIYISLDGKYFLAGNLFLVTDDGIRNLTESALRKDRLDSLKSLPAEAYLRFDAKGQNDANAILTIFTDITCSYCQMLHNEVATLNQQGISVRYLAFPREGLNGMAAAGMSAIWCSDQQQAALGQAFQELPAKSDDRCRPAITQGFELGQRIGVMGTPAIVLPNGELGAGFLSAGQLADAVRLALLEN